MNKATRIALVTGEMRDCMTPGESSSRRRSVGSQDHVREEMPGMESPLINNQEGAGGNSCCCSSSSQSKRSFPGCLK